MRDRIPQYIALIERRTSLLRALARELVDCRKDFLALDSDAMFARVSAQEELCGRIRAVDSAILSLRAHASTGKAAISDELVRGALADLNGAQAELAQLNRVHAAYLRRCGRTLRLFSNFFRSLSLTYAPQQAGEYAPGSR